MGIGGPVSVSGVVLTVLGPWLGSAYLGTALWALGVCLVFPAAMSAAGESPHRPTDAIAAVATIGYAGILVGPPLIGSWRSASDWAGRCWSSWCSPA